MVLDNFGKVFGEFCLVVMFDGDNVFYIVCVVVNNLLSIDLGCGSCLLVWVMLMGWVLLSVLLEE